MRKARQQGVTRRSFLVGTAAAGAGLTVGVYLTDRERIVVAPVSDPSLDRVAVEWDPRAFVHIGDDNLVTVQCKHTEMGQGIYTAMAIVVAEELDAAWDQMRVEGAPADAALYSHLHYGEQFTGGSSSLNNAYEQLRQVGAAARQMLIEAAASEWNVAAGEIVVRDGELSHVSSGRAATFGDLSGAASRQPAPQSVSLKSRDQYRLVGNNLLRVDVESKTNGTARFTQDLVLPGMLTAVVEHAPRFGAIVQSFDATAARDLAGVTDVVEVPGGVAVVAENFWTAMKARDRLSIEWDDTNAFTLGSAELMSEFREIAETPGIAARDDGAVDDALAIAEHVVEAEFEFPYLAHAPSEPMDCIVHLSVDKCEIWSGGQQQTRDQNGAAEILGMSPDQIEVNMLYAGGGFGRRANKDYTMEAVEVAKAVERDVPIKLVWTREDDMRAGQYRPMNFHRARAGIDDRGNLVGWHHRLVGQSIAKQEEPTWFVDGVDEMSVHGAHDMLYDVPNIRVETHSPEYPVPILWYRGVGSTHTVFAVETIMDELAMLAERDAVEFRLALLGQHPRMRRVLELVADKAGWGSALRSGSARGIALCRQRGTYLAQVAEVSLEPGNTFSVDRVTTAVDCGLPINPDGIRAQMQGGTGFGLSSALYDEITLQDGYVQQANFDSYPILRIDQMPEIDVHIVPSTESPTGVGELAPMTVGPAVANALSVLTGERIRGLPIRLTG
jgi:isoquinoline 1-oxidoreductase beta subunit